MVQPLKLETNKLFRSALNWAYYYLSTHGTKLVHVDEMGPRDMSQAGDKISQIPWHLQI